jgi:hypothetical protein
MKDNAECETAKSVSKIYNIHGVHSAGLSDFSVRDAARRHFFSASGAALSQEVPTVK